MYNKFSIIIPVLNEAENICDILNEIECFFITPNSIKNNEYEIIIVDDGSSDNISGKLKRGVNNEIVSTSSHDTFYNVNLGLCG